MRILHVSAHFPPNFVSGGTLVPLRLARGLHARGHDVAVYAGFLDASRRPLEAWTEPDETGLPVRWITSTPWIDWADCRNFDNPAVTADFTAFLREWRADVVHLHSLQSLGAGLLPVARAGGAKVVVTMHDFWWVCARQFLVTKDERPCCLVVDAGGCPCEVDHGWLLERNAFLRERLAAVDLVLAPSASAARVLAANGVDPDRLVVDENGLPDPPPAARPAVSRRKGGPVRFVFAGGEDPMKGLPVLRRSLRRLDHVTGWQLDAFGVDPGRLDLDGLPVRALPPYRPGELDEVLAAHDVLVLPSLMRESHSILTREALRAGLAVVCTNTLGPEEVVDPGRNGLVVPAGDDLVLADALRRLVEDRPLLQAMRAAAPAVPIRSVDDQVSGLERRYLGLLQAPARTAARPSLRFVLFVVGIEGAPLRYRARLAAEGLGLEGVRSEVRHYRDVELPRLADHADAVVFYRVPATHQVLELAAAIRRRPEPVPLVFDVDDLIFDESLRPEVRGISHLPLQEVELWWQGVRRYRTTMEACDLYLGSTDELCRHAASVTGMPVRRWDNGVGLLLAQAGDAALARARRPGPVRLGYFSGTTTHDNDWALVEPAVVDVLRRHPDAELWVGGHLTTTAALQPVAARVRRLPFLPWYELPRTLRDLDINLAPLELGSRFNEAKSAIKWLEAALVATPTVAAPTKPFREAISPGVNGLLAGPVEEWVAALDTLVTDEALRRRLGERARRDALLGWSPHLQGRRYLAILDEARTLVTEQGHRVPTSTWHPVALDEPYLPVALEPYVAGPATLAPPPPAPAARWLRALRTLRRLARRAAEVGRTEGFATVARGLARTALRLVRRMLAASLRYRR